MSRSISIGGLAFHNVKIGVSDSIKFKFDETKADKTGEFVQENNCYANPINPHLCFFLALDKLGSCQGKQSRQRVQAVDTS